MGEPFNVERLLDEACAASVQNLFGFPVDAVAAGKQQPGCGLFISAGHLLDDTVYFFESRIQSIRLISAGLCHIGSPSASSADNGCNLLYDISGMKAVGQVFGDHRDQQGFVVCGTSEHHHTGGNPIPESISQVPQRGGRVGGNAF
jgi:hypothetical protein